MFYQHRSNAGQSLSTGGFNILREALHWRCNRSASSYYSHVQCSLHLVAKLVLITLATWCLKLQTLVDENWYGFGGNCITWYLIWSYFGWQMHNVGSTLWPDMKLILILWHRLLAYSNVSLWMPSLIWDVKVVDMLCKWGSFAFMAYYLYIQSTHNIPSTNCYTRSISALVEIKNPEFWVKPGWKIPIWKSSC